MHKLSPFEVLILVLLQFTEEKLGSAEKTELDAHFENLLQRADKTKVWTEKILKQTEGVLQPNPSKFLMHNLTAAPSPPLLPNTHEG